MSVPVLLAISGPAEAELVAGWGSRRREVVVVRRCADLAEVLAAAGAGAARAAVLGADVVGADAETVDALARAGVALVVLLPAGAQGESAERSWRQRGATAFAHEGGGAGAVAEVVVAAVESLARGTGTNRRPDGDAPPEVPTARTSQAGPGVLPAGTGRVLAVWGPHGSVGRTTIAVNVAAELAARGEQVTLVDADTRGAAVAQALGVLDEAPVLLAAVRAATEGRLDAAEFGRLAPQVLPGLVVLSGSPDPARWSELRPVGLRRVLEVAAATSDWVVVDLPGGLGDEDGPSSRDAVTSVVLDVCDGALVVGAADPVGLQRWIRSWQRRGDDFPGVALPVLNRLRASAVGAPAGRRVTETVRRFAGVHDPVLLPDDVAADTAVLAGRTLGEATPRSPLRRALVALVQELDGLVPVGEGWDEAQPHRGFDPLLARS